MMMELTICKRISVFVEKLCIKYHVEATAAGTRRTAGSMLH